MRHLILGNGAFSELQQHGRWTVTPEKYVARVRRYRNEIGQMLWAAPQDMMAEPPIIYGGQYGRERFVGTRQFLDPDNRLTHEQLIVEHLRRTVANYVRLVELDPTLPWRPVVQGWRVWHYLLCIDLYGEAGVDLTTMSMVGVGSVCRRQNTSEAGEILAALHDRGLTRKHAFGFKILGLQMHRPWIWSADSLAWSDTARKYHRRAVRLGLPHGLMRGCAPGPRHPAQNCANCLPYALRWRADALAAARSGTPDTSRQLALWPAEEGNAA